MPISAEQVKELRERTGAGILDCKRALEACGGDPAAALDHLRRQGLAQAAKKTSRTAGQGLIGSYIHANGKIGVLLELNCETDFVAQTDEFSRLAHQIAMQICAAAPEYITAEEVSPERVEAEKAIYEELARNEGRPEQAIPRIVEGRLKKFFSQVCLMDQEWVIVGEDDKKGRSVRDVIGEAVGKLGENIQVRRFSRFALNENEGVR